MKVVTSRALPAALLLGLLSFTIVFVSCSASPDSSSPESGSDGIQEIESPQDENPLFSVAMYGTEEEFTDCLAGTDRMLERDPEGCGVLYFLYVNSSESRIGCLRALGDAGFPFASHIDDRDAYALEEIVTRGFAQDLAFLREAGVAPGRIAPYRDNAVRWLVHGVAGETAEQSLLDGLLRDGCSVSFRNEYGDTALSEACRNGLYSLALRLSRLERKEADLAGMALEPAYYTECGRFAVTATLAETETESLKPLLAEFLRRGMNLQTVLCACCDYGGTVEALTVALELGADPDASCENGDLPMFVASDAEILRVLLDHGARIDALNGDGISALTNACARGDSGIALFLLERGAKILDGDFSEAFYNQSYDLCLALLDAGAHPERAFSGQENPLCRMADNGESLSDDGTELARRLIAAGYRVDESDAEGKTAIYRIILAGDDVPPEAAEVFIEAAGPQTVASTRVLIESERELSRRQDLGGRAQLSCCLASIAILLLVSSVWFRESVYSGKREQNWLCAVSAFLGLVFAGILTGGSVGLLLDSLDTSSHGWLRLPVWTMLGIPAGCLAGFVLVFVTPIRRLFYRFSVLYYIPFGLTIAILGISIGMVWV